MRKVCFISYIVLLLVLVTVALCVLFMWLVAYQETRIETALSAYESSFIDTLDEKPAMQAYLSGLDSEICSQEESLSVIHSELQSGYAFKSVHSSESGCRQYKLVVNGHDAGTVGFIQNVENRFNMTGWTLSSEEFNFDYLKAPVSVTVPEGYSVIAGGHILPRTYVTESFSCAELENIASLVSAPIPVFETWTVDNAIGDVTFEIRDETGRVVAPENVNEEYFLNNCSQEEEAEITTLCEEFFSYYTKFMNVNGTGYIGYLRKYVVPGSDLSDRLTGALDGLGYVITNTNPEISDMKVTRCVKLDESEYVCDLTFTLTLTGTAGSSVEQNTYRMLISNDGTGMLFYAMLTM